MKKNRTPRFIINRVREIVYHKTSPDHPWLTKDANKFLDENLKKDFKGVEFGSGRSTMWFAKRLDHLTSVEHHKDWYTQVSKKLKDNNIQNVDYVLREIEEEKIGEHPDYATVLDRFDDESLDFILVDGGPRDVCALKAIPKLKKGGYLVVDNINWYIPRKTHAPQSRGPNDGFYNKNWEQFSKKIENWEKIWTSSGVTDTAIFIKA